MADTTPSAGEPPARAGDHWPPPSEPPDGADPGPARAEIGLATVRRAAHAMGSEITVESEVGRGSAFSIELPAVPGGSGAPG